MQRLDKFLASNTPLSRNEVHDAIKYGRVVINGLKAKQKDQKIDEQTDKVFWDNQEVCYKKYIYLMLNKPSGVVSATNDKKQKTVLDLLPTHLKKFDLFPCGRLDKDTLGLVILTNDGKNAHRLLSPKNHVEKTYEFVCANNLTDLDIRQIECGIQLKDGYITKPCKINLILNNTGTITITEGKYHEIKRIFGAIGNRITFLKRISFGKILLDEKLKDGEYRELNYNEQKYFEGKI